ncbi:hypothetical protein SFRURICE_007626, partial [Spodoptera frugiperda]
QPTGFMASATRNERKKTSSGYLKWYVCYSFVGRFQQVDWGVLKRDTHILFTKLIRTKDPRDLETNQNGPGKQRLSVSGV